MSFTDEDMQLAVKRGAYWLDQNHPGWASRINLYGLVMQNCELCVIGQAVAGTYTQVLKQGAKITGESIDDWAVAQGFQAPDFYKDRSDMSATTVTGSYYAKLEEIWTDEVRKRLG